MGTKIKTVILIFVGTLFLVACATPVHIPAKVKIIKVDVPINTVPAPPVLVRPDLVINHIPKKDMHNPGIVAKYIYATTDQLMQYINALEQVIGVYAKLAAENPAAIKPNFVKMQTNQIIVSNHQLLITARSNMQWAKKQMHRIKQRWEQQKRKLEQQNEQLIHNKS